MPQVFDPVRYPLDQILLMNHLAQGSGLIVHSAGLALEGMGMVFAGVSGAGKSTLTGIFAREAPEAELLSDDRIIVRQIDGRWHAYGTPWPGEAGVASNSRAGLGALFFLAKGPAHRLEPLSPAQALKRLLPVVSCPWYDSERLTGVLDTCERLVGQVPCFELRFKPGPGVVALLRDFVHRERGVWTRSESCPKPIP